VKSAFRKISRVSSLTGGTKWYLSDDCLLAAKRVMYAVEYRRFYLHDLESIVVWPSRTWVWRLTVPGLLLILIGFAFSRLDFTTGVIFGVLGLGWSALELVRGPTAKSRIRTTGASVDLLLVKRTRGARKVLAKINAAVRATRDAFVQPAAPVTSPEPVRPSSPSTSEDSAAAPIADVTQTNGS